MSLKTLLEAAKFIELQEQLNSRPPALSSPLISSTSPSSSSSSSSDAYHHNRNNFLNNSHHNSTSNNNNNHSTNLNNNTNQNSSSSSNSRNNHRNHHHYADYYRRGRRGAAAAASPPTSPVNSSTTSALLVNGVGGGGGINGNHVVGISGAMGPSSNATNLIGATNNNHNSNLSHSEQGSNSYDFHTRHRHEYRATSNGTTGLNTDGRKSEEPCRNGEHPITPPSSYLLTSASKETDSAAGTTTLATNAVQLSKQDSRATSSDPFSAINCKKVTSNFGNKIEINSKCLSTAGSNNDHGLPLLRPASSSPAFNVGYPVDSNKLQVIPTSRSPIPYAPPPSKIKKPTPLTPPPTSSRKFVEKTRTRSSSLSSTNFTANVSNSINSNGSLTATTGASSTGLAATTPAVSASDGSSLVHSRMAAAIGAANGNVLANSGTEDSSHSSLNLSSSGYLSGSSANSSVGVSSSLSNLNISNSSTSSLPPVGHGSLNGYGPNDHQLAGQGSARRRTISTNSSGGKQRSPCILRAGTREVHNKLEKHRRAHLKECFEQLKSQLQLRDEEKKKTSNLAILGAAYRHVMTLKKKERELEQQVEQLAKEKINYQKRILSLKRELSSKHDNFDFPSIMSENDIAMVKEERDSISDTLSSARGCARYSSSSSLSSTITIPSPSGSGNLISNSLPPHAVSPPVIMPTSLTLNASSSPSNHLHTIHLQHLPKSISPVTAIGNHVPLPLTTKSLQLRGSPTPSTPSPSSSSMNGIPPSSPIVSSSASPSSNSTSSLCASPPIIVPQSPLGALIAASNASTHVPISLKIPHVPNGVKVPLPGSIISSTSPHIPPSSSPLSSSASLSIISSTTNNPTGLSLASMTSTTAASLPPVLNYTTNEHNSILASASLAAATTLHSGLPLNLNASASPSQVQILHAAVAKDLSGKNGICRKVHDLHEQPSISTSLVVTPSHQQPFSTASMTPVSEIVVTNNASTTTISTKDKMSDDGEQPKFINVLNGLQGNAMGLVLSQIPMFAASPQSLRMLGTGGLATIELTTSQVQPQSRNHLLSSPTSTATPTTGAQLHKLLVSGTTVSTSSGPNTTNGGNGLGVGAGGSSSSVAATAVASELARLPGGAEVNLLSRNGKMTIVNNGITLKGADGSNSRAAMHVMAPIQSGGASISRLAPLMVSQGKVANNLAAHLIAPSSQLTRQVNLSVGGQQLPIISTPYLTSPMVVAVASNQTQPTLSSVPPTATSVAVATATANGSVS